MAFTWNHRFVLMRIEDDDSVKAPGACKRGYDTHKKISGRKRHVAVDTDGRLLAVNLTPADIADSAAETINEIYKAEIIYRRAPWKMRDAIELATLECAAEADANHYTQLSSQAVPA